MATFPGRRAEAAARRGQAARLERRRAQQHRVRGLRSGERRARASRQPDALRRRVGHGHARASSAATTAGATWKPVPGQPTKYRPNHAVLASDGNLFISYGTDPGPMPMIDGAVWKLDTRAGGWTDITPDKPSPTRKDARKFGYGAVAVDAHDPKVLIASSFYRPKGEEVFRSTDGGATWKAGVRGRRRLRLRARALREGHRHPLAVRRGDRSLATPTTRCSPPATAAGRRTT